MQPKTRHIQGIDHKGSIEREQNIFQSFGVLRRNLAAVTAISANRSGRFVSAVGFSCVATYNEYAPIGAP